MCSAISNHSSNATEQPAKSKRPHSALRSKSGGISSPGYLRLISLLTSMSIVPTMSGVNAVKTTLYKDM